MTDPRPLDLEGFSPVARAAILRAATEARAQGHDSVGTEHLLVALVAAPGAASRILEALGAEPARVWHAVEQTIEPGSPGSGHDEPGLGSSARAAMLGAVAAARALGSAHVGPEHLLLAVALETEGSGARALAGLGIGAEEVRREVEARRTGDQPPF